MSNSFGMAANAGMYLANQYGSAASAYGNAANSAFSSLGSSLGSIASAGLKYGAMNNSALGAASAPVTSLMDPKASYYDSKTNTITDPNQHWTMRNWRGGN